MNILLTNDDGIEAGGLLELEEALSFLGKITVVAPLRNNSAIGHAISIHNPVTVHKFPPGSSGADRVAVDGTPADAVKFALKNIFPSPPNLVFSGINSGPNIGHNIFYSGTVGAAREAVIQGISSVAVSVDAYPHPDFSAAAHFAVMVAKLAGELELERQAQGKPPFCLNLNVPGLPLEQIKGLKLTRHGHSGFDEFFFQRRGAPEDEYWIDGKMQLRDPDDTYDGTALQHGYATLTPLTIDLTDAEMYKSLKTRETLL